MNILTRTKLFLYRHFRWLRKPSIRVLEAQMSGNGSFIDMRYWLARPDKIDPKGKIYIIHEESGEKLYLMHIARFGAIRTRHNKYNNTGNLLFYNRNGLVKQGAKVSLYMDELAATGIVIC